MGKKGYSLLTFLLVFSILALATFVKAENKPTDARDPYGYPIDTVSFTNIRQLLFNRDYQKLNTILDNYQKEFERDFRNEYKVYDAFNAFGAPIPSLQPLFDEWVQKYPNLYQPYLARAFYYNILGWESRGYKWAKDTSEEQFAGMEAYFTLAKKDIYTVMSINERSICCYRLLINMNMTFSDDKENRVLINKGLKLFPYSFLLRSIYLKNLKPRWGGSYEEMDQFAEEAQKYAKMNPRLRLLKGFSFIDHSNYIEHREGKYQEAIALCQKALSFGDYWEFYYELASNYVALKKYSEALQMINKAIALNPQEINCYKLRAEIYYRLNNFEKSKDDIQTAVNICPGFSTTESTRKWLAERIVSDGYNYYKLKEYTKSIPYYSWAIAFKSDHAPAYYWRGRSYSYLKKYDLALADLKQSIQLDPHDYYSYLALDWVLAQSRQWDVIISYWDQYIALEPNDGRAYRERGGAYYQKGDMTAALADAKKAADLGDEEGKKIYERLKNMAK